MSGKMRQWGVFMYKAQKKFADLKIQAMLFDMDIDIETWSLVKRPVYKEAFWITNWREKLANSDYTPDGSDDQEWDKDGRR